MSEEQNLLDEYFPRTQPEPQPEPVEVFTGVKIIENIPWQPTRKAVKRDKNKITGKKLEKIGEGLTQYALGKFGIDLKKIPLRENYYGFTSIDVDFQGTERAVKVEAKAWWIYKKSFATSRFSANERRYLNAAMRGNYETWVSIALLDVERPTRRDCDVLYVLPWAEWLRIEAALLARSSGNYKGKSLRRRDLDLLEGYTIERVKGRWKLPEGHWLLEVNND